MTTAEKLALVQRELAGRWGCAPEAFTSPDNQFFPSTDTFFEVLTFGQSAVFRADATLLPWCEATFATEKARYIMDSENLFKIETKLREHGYRLCGEHVRYAYLDESRAPRKPEGFRYALYMDEAVKALHVHKGFDNAFNYKCDVIAHVAYDGDTVAAIAAADDYLGALWQIGIDTVAAYRGHGLAAYLVKGLADAILAEGKMPFYTTWTPNLASTRVALSCGFLPAWVGYMAEKIDAAKEKA